MTTDRRLMVLLGTKAQFIKTAPILLELDRRSVAYHLVYTGQHVETFDLLEKAFGTRPPDDILVPNFEAATRPGFLRWTLLYWAAVVRRMRTRDWRRIAIGIVHGDTASTLFGTLTFKLIGAKVAHVEAGLRSSRLLEPFPEELVRRLVSRLTSLHLAPDELACNNLCRSPGRVVLTQGNTLRDSLTLALKMVADRRSCTSPGYGVISFHRNENLSNGAALDLLVTSTIEAAKVLPVKLVLHPATRERLARHRWWERLTSEPGLELLERMDYPDFIALLLGSKFLLTDGGSNQEEAAMLGLPTLLLRRETERHDGLGDNVELSGLDRNKIQGFVTRHAQADWNLRSIADTSPAEICVDAILQELAESANS